LKWPGARAHQPCRREKDTYDNSKRPKDTLQHFDLLSPVKSLYN
jgi:hypothetical protein